MMSLITASDRPQAGAAYAIRANNPKTFKQNKPDKATARRMRLRSHFWAFKARAMNTKGGNFHG